MKFDINDKELMAKLLVALMEEKAGKERMICIDNDIKLKEEEETDCLYYWILSRLYQVANSRIPASAHVSIIIKGKMNMYNKILLTHSHDGEYLPLYIEGTKFFDVVENTLEIFNSFSKFSASMISRNDEFGCCEFFVSF